MSDYIKKARLLAKKLPNADLDETDLKSLCLSIMLDIEGDSAQHHKARIEALRLLTDFYKEEEESKDIETDRVLQLLSGGKG